MVVGEVGVPNTNENISIERFHNITNKLKNAKCNVIIGTDQNHQYCTLYNCDYLEMFHTTGYSVLLYCFPLKLK